MLVVLSISSRGNVLQYLILVGCNTLTDQVVSTMYFLVYFSFFVVVAMYLHIFFNISPYQETFTCNITQ